MPMRWVQYQVETGYSNDSWGYGTVVTHIETIVEITTTDFTRTASQRPDRP